MQSLNTLTFNPDSLTVTINGLNKLWGFKNTISIPYAQIIGATVDNDILSDFKGIRRIGLHLPGKYVGTFTHHHELTFYNACVNYQDTIVIQLRHHHFERLVLGVADGKSLVNAINRHRLY